MTCTNTYYCGKDNFAADREMAERGLKLMSEMLDSSRGNRDFLVRAVRFLRDAGVRQFPRYRQRVAHNPNKHEIAQEGHSDARVVYIDDDPVVFLRTEALMARNSTSTVVRADLRDVEEVLAQAGQLLDFTRPVALMFVAALYCIVDEDAPAANGRELIDPGLVLASHWRPHGNFPDHNADRAWSYGSIASI
jgi:hypothetical protein